MNGRQIQKKMKLQTRHVKQFAISSSMKQIISEGDLQKIYQFSFSCFFFGKIL